MVTLPILFSWDDGNHVYNISQPIINRVLNILKQTPKWPIADLSYNSVINSSTKIPEPYIIGYTRSLMISNDSSEYFVEAELLRSKQGSFALIPLIHGYAEFDPFLSVFTLVRFSDFIGFQLYSLDTINYH
jgi:hypothetical protein